MSSKTVIAAFDFTYVCGYRPATRDVCKIRGCDYNFWAPDDERCVAQNMLSY